MANSLDSDEDQHFIRSDWGPLMLSLNTSMQRVDISSAE